MEQCKPYLLTLKENHNQWKDTTLQEKETGLQFLVEILNLKISNQEEADHMNRQIVLISDLISTKFPKITIPEIKEAMKMYVSKSFVDIKVFRILDCISIGEILSAYIDFRNESTTVFIEKRKSLLLEKKEVTEEEKLKIRKEFLQMVFDEVWKDGFCNDAHFLFKEMESKGLIKLSNEEKQKIYDKELHLYIPEEQNRIRFSQPYSASKAIEKFKKTIESGNKLVTVQNRCRSIIVSDLIKQRFFSVKELEIALL